MLKRILLSLLFLHTVTQTGFPITMEQSKDKTKTTYKHGEHFMGAWYYDASYDETTGLYRTYRGQFIHEFLERNMHRPSNPSYGPAGSYQAECYEALKKRYDEQEAAENLEESK
jgi:hypothetical protein